MCIHAYIVPCTLYIVQYTLYILHFTVHIVFPEFTVQFTVNSIQYTVYTVNYIEYGTHIQCEHCTVYTVQRSMYIASATYHKMSTAACNICRSMCRYMCRPMSRSICRPMCRIKAPIYTRSILGGDLENLLYIEA